MKTIKRVLIMAGGTGGHVFPGLALAGYLQNHGIEVHWLGTRQGLEAKLVPQAQLPLHFISVTGLRGKGIKPILMAPFKLLRALGDALRVIKQVNPDVVVGMGGFVSGPGGLASWLARRPLVIHEQNARAGMTNQLLSPIARRILAGFPGAFKPQDKLCLIGNPVRQAIETLPFPRPHQPSRLLILGGSLGAQALNEAVPRALAKLKPEERPEIWHQTGDKHYTQTQQHYAALGITGAKVTPFISDMAHAYGWATMVLCRAGALTVAELCAAGLGAIFVPYPYAVDDHQTANAGFMVQHQAAICIQQADLTDEGLATVIKRLAALPDQAAAMGKAAFALRKVNVTKQFYEILCDVM